MSLLSDLGGVFGEMSQLKDELVSSVTESLSETTTVAGETVQQLKESAEEIMSQATGDTPTDNDT